jgi:hypothetical protein
MVAWVIRAMDAGNAHAVPTPVPTSLGFARARYAVVSEQMSDEALELFVDRQMPSSWSRAGTGTSPIGASKLHVEPVELETSAS